MFVYKPDKPPAPETRYFIWHKTPKRLSLATNTVRQVEDKQAYVDTGWAKGRSQHKKLETRAAANNTCQDCGTTIGPLITHHPNRLAKAKRVKKGWGHVAQSGMAQQLCLLCHNLPYGLSSQQHTPVTLDNAMLESRMQGQLARPAWRALKGDVLR